MNRPAPLATVVSEIATASGADSAVRAYRALRNRYYGRAAYDFGEVSLNSAALQLGHDKKFDDALALLTLNDEAFPNSSELSLSRGDISLMKGDTAAAERAFREAIRRDSTNNQARGRLRAIGRQP